MGVRYSRNKKKSQRIFFLLVFTRNQKKMSVARGTRQGPTATSARTFELGGGTPAHVDVEVAAGSDDDDLADADADTLRHRGIHHVSERLAHVEALLKAVLAQSHSTERAAHAATEAALRATTASERSASLLEAVKLSPMRPRQTRVPSCMRCSALHIQCSRGHPCSNCAASLAPGGECVYPPKGAKLYRGAAVIAMRDPATGMNVPVAPPASRKRPRKGDDDVSGAAGSPNGLDTTATDTATDTDTDAGAGAGLNPMAKTKPKPMAKAKAKHDAAPPSKRGKKDAV